MATQPGVVKHDIKDLTFGVYTDEEIERLSVVEITESRVFDRNFGISISGGLVDPRLGPIEDGEMCVGENVWSSGGYRRSLYETGSSGHF